jgi:ATP-binding cassette subfamily C (CFTR/MRP) protein 4
MVKKLIRSQAFYFDVIPSNQLLSRFSNDLTVLDTMLSYSFKVMFEKSAAVLIALVTVTSLNFSFVIVLVVGGALCLYLVARYKNKIIYSRKVYLLAKDPIFKDFTEGVSGNLQLRLADQCKSRVSLFGEKLNREFETMFSGYLLSRTLGLWLCYTYLFFMYIGLIIGAYFLHEDQANLFGVQIILLMQINTSI